MWRWHTEDDDDVIIETYLTQLTNLYPLTEVKQTQAKYPIFPLDVCYNPDDKDTKTTLESFEEANPIVSISTQFFGIDVPSDSKDKGEPVNDNITTQDTFSFTSSICVTPNQNQSQNQSQN